MRNLIKGRGLVSFLVIGTLLLAAIGFTSISPAQAQSTCGNPYYVQSGDNLTTIANVCSTTVNALLKANPQISNPSQLTVGQQIYIPGTLVSINGQPVYIAARGDYLTSIAVRYGITYKALLQANPQISNPSLIFPGQRINLPAGIIPITGEQAQVSLSQFSGPASTQVTVSGTAFPANTIVSVLMSEEGGGATYIASITTDANGSFTTLVTIPDNARAGSTWIITATTQISGGPTATAQFQVSPQFPSGPYTVQPGDTLSGIAQRFGTTVNALLRANPQISNRNQLAVGQQIYIPGTLVSINGQPVYIVKHGDYLTAIAVRYGITYQALLQANPQISNPRLIFPGQRINLLAGIIPITGAQAEVALSRSNGPAGTQLTVRGTAFPANTPVSVVIGEQGAGAATIASTTTGSDGSFTALATIPSDARAGSIWIFTATTQTSGGPTATAQFQVSAQLPTGPYTVQPGDTLSSIAQRFGLTVNDLLRANPQINNSNAITPGQKINIPYRISFEPGAISGTVTGRLEAYSTYYYVLRAQANQKMQVDLTPENGITLSVIGANGAVLKSAITGGSHFSGTLPSSQDYILALTAGNSPVSYTMNVTIPAQ
jgi:peptidoglycan endopeptidase LytF